MAYKRFFYRNGKKFGPYYYESYRDKSGKIKKRYIGMNPDKNIKENANSNKQIEENINKKDLNEVIPTKSNIILLVLLVLALILMDLFAIFYYV
jgi:hypothetical protein